MSEKKVSADYRIPIVQNEDVPPGMAWIGYDEDGTLVCFVNTDEAEDDEERLGGP